MLVLGIILLILFLLLTVILLDPFELRIDTVAGEYCLRWRGLVSVRLTGEVPDPVMRLWVMGWRRDFRLLEMGGGREKEEDEKAPKPAKKKKRRRPKWLTFRLMRRLLHTFRVHTYIPAGARYRRLRHERIPLSRLSSAFLPEAAAAH